MKTIDNIRPFVTVGGAPAPYGGDAAPKMRGPANPAVSPPPAKIGGPANPAVSSDPSQIRGPRNPEVPREPPVMKGPANPAVTPPAQ